MWVDPSNSYIALYIMRNLVPLNNCITVFNNKNALSIIFINFIVVYGRTCHFLDFYSSLCIVTYHMVVYYWTIIVLAHYQNTIESVCSYANVFTDYSLAKILFIRTANYTITFAFFYFVEWNVWKCTIDLDALCVLNYDVSWNLGFTC